MKDHQFVVTRRVGSLKMILGDSLCFSRGIRYSMAGSKLANCMCSLSGSPKGIYSASKRNPAFLFAHDQEMWPYISLVRVLCQGFLPSITIGPSRLANPTLDGPHFCPVDSFLVPCQNLRPRFERRQLRSFKISPISESRINPTGNHFCYKIVNI